VEALDGKIEAAALGVLEEQEVRVAALRSHGAQAVVAADAVRLVDHEVARVEVGEGGDGRAPLEDGTAQPPPARAEDVLLGEQDKPEGGQLEARRAIARDDTEALGAPEGGVGPRRRAPPPVAPRGPRGRRGRPAPPRAATRAGRDRRRLPPGGAPSARRASPRTAAWSDRRAGAIRPRPRRTPRARADRG